MTKEQVVAAAIREVIEEDSRLETLAECTPAEFETRLILLGEHKAVAIRHADRTQLCLLATQLTAAGLPIPDLLQRKLAA